MKPRQYSDEELEQMLRQSLTPRKPAWESDREVLEAFLLKDEKSVRRSERREIFRYSWVASLGVVAALAIAFVYFLQTPTRPEAGSDLVNQTSVSDAMTASIAPVEYRAVGHKNKLVKAKDLGWKQVDDENVAREYRYDYVDTVDLIDEEDGSIVRLEVPRQEIINVTYQVI